MSDSLGRTFFEFREGFKAARVRQITDPSETVYTNLSQVGFQTCVRAPPPHFFIATTHSQFFLCARAQMTYNKGGTLARVLRGIDRKEPVDHMVSFNTIQAVVVDRMSDGSGNFFAAEMELSDLPKETREAFNSLRANFIGNVEDDDEWPVLFKDTLIAEARRALNSGEIDVPRAIGVSGHYGPGWPFIHAQTRVWPDIIKRIYTCTHNVAYASCLRLARTC